MAWIGGKCTEKTQNYLLNKHQQLTNSMSLKWNTYLYFLSILKINQIDTQ